MDDLTEPCAMFNRQRRKHRLRVELPQKKSPRKWVHATGSPVWLEAQAITYLMQFDHGNAWVNDRPAFTLAKVVCNLRNYHLQSKEETIELIMKYFNGKCGVMWSPEGIGLTWEMVEPYTPSLGLKDETAVRLELAAELYELAVDLVLMLEQGGRVLVTDLYAFFLEVNPDLDPVPTDVAFGIAFGDATCRKSTPSRSKRYWSGFRIPEEYRKKVAA